MNEMRRLIEAVDQTLNESTGKVGREISRGNKLRVFTGVRNTSIPLPYETQWTDVNSFDWRRQAGNFQRLQTALDRNGTPLTQVAGRVFQGEADYLTRFRRPNLHEFVAVSPGVLVWQKYALGGGKNTVFVGGEAMMLTAFLALDEFSQDSLIQQSAQIQ